MSNTMLRTRPEHEVPSNTQGRGPGSVRKQDEQVFEGGRPREDQEEAGRRRKIRRKIRRTRRFSDERKSKRHSRLCTFINITAECRSGVGERGYVSVVGLSDVGERSWWVAEGQATGGPVRMGCVAVSIRPFHLVLSSLPLLNCDASTRLAPGGSAFDSLACVPNEVNGETKHGWEEGEQEGP